MEIANRHHNVHAFKQATSRQMCLFGIHIICFLGGISYAAMGISRMLNTYDIRTFGINFRSYPRLASATYKIVLRKFPKSLFAQKPGTKPQGPRHIGKFPRVPHDNCRIGAKIHFLPQNLLARRRR